MTSSTYLGSVCKRDPLHGGERYKSNGGCVGCVRQTSARWKLSKPEKHLEHNRASYHRHAETRRAARRQYAKRFPERNAAAFAAYQARKLQATPAWANQEVIASVYALSRAWTQALGVRVEVDHIEPLRGRHVSGLHCEANLTLLLKSDNLAKGNRPKRYP